MVFYLSRPLAGAPSPKGKANSGTKDFREVDFLHMNDASTSLDSGKAFPKWEGAREDEGFPGIRSSPQNLKERLFFPESTISLKCVSWKDG